MYGKMLRLFPVGMPGKTRLAHLMLGSNCNARDVRVIDDYGCAFIVPNLREPVGFYLFIDGLYEPDAARFVANHLHAGSTFVDVGANIGTFSALAAKRVGPTGRVISIEPSPQVRPYLERTLIDNDLRNVRVKPYAACNNDGQTISFYEAPPDHFGMGSLAPQFNALPTIVPGRTLDCILVEEELTHVDLLKVDVEGFEASVFKGAKVLLTGTRPPIVLFEFSDWAEQRALNIEVGEAQQILNDWGYQIWRLSDFPQGAALNKPLVNGFEMLVAARN
jgi:FkbM family methyltransferase